MPLVYITGVSGSGKSAVREELVSRGYIAYDTDKNRISGYFRVATGEEVYTAAEEREKRSAQWYAEHHWRTKLPRLERLRSESENKLVFICGMAVNRLDVMALCDITFTLFVDEDTLKERISNRKKSYGKQPHELERILISSKKKLLEDQRAGSHIIDSSRPVNIVVDEILETTQSVLHANGHQKGYNLTGKM